MMKQRGSTFILTIGVMASLVAILAAAAATQQVSVRAATNRVETRKARLAAESGVQRALALLQTQDRNVTNQTDEWFEFGREGAEKFVVADSSFRIQIVDASSLVNLNTASQAILERLPMDSEQVDSLLDWREAGTTPRGTGAKDEYYNGLTTPYNAKLRPLDTLDELLLVKGFAAAKIFEPRTDVVNSGQVLPQKANGEEQTLYDLVTVESRSTNVDAQGQPKPNIATATLPQLIAAGIPLQQAQAIFQARAGLTTYRAMLQVAGNPNTARVLLNTFGVGNVQQQAGKINVNTASEAVLQTLPDLPTDVASAIISRQSTGLTQLGDLFDIPGYSLQVAQATADLFSVNSQTFLIRTIGTSGRISVALETLVTLTTDGPQITTTMQLPFTDMVRRWGWQEETSSETVLKEATNG